MLETIGDGLGDAINTQRDLITFVHFDALGVGFAGELDHLDRGIFDPGSVAPSKHGNPDLARQLRGQLMKLQCRQQAENSLWHADGHGDQTLMFGKRTLRESVEAATCLFQLAARSEARQVHPRDAHFIQIAGTQDTLPAYQMKQTVCMSVFAHCP